MMTAFIAAMLSLGCSRTPPDPCAAYIDNPATLGWCRVEKAGEAATIEEAHCEGLSEMEEHCRVRWVQGHTDRDLVELKAACTTDECRFVALDWKPLPFRLQFDECAVLGRLANPCRVHAAARFFGGRPSLEGQRQELAGLEEHSFVLGNQAGLARYCGIEVDCSLFADYSPACEEVGRYGRMGGECTSFRVRFPRP